MNMVYGLWPQTTHYCSLQATAHFIIVYFDSAVKQFAKVCRTTAKFCQGTCVYIINILPELRDLTNKLVVKVALLEEENEQLKDQKKQLKNKMSKIEKKAFYTGR